MKLTEEMIRAVTGTWFTPSEKAFALSGIVLEAVAQRLDPVTPCDCGACKIRREIAADIRAMKDER